ncbi:MAG: HpsJ family protein [Synechococcaceae cyanobacterium ELA739]
MTKSHNDTGLEGLPEPLDAELPISPNSIRGLSLAGIALIGLYATIVISSCFPVQLLRPAWQLQVGAALINSSPLALIGLVLLHLTADLEPEDPVLIFRRSLAAQLAVLASVGFLLLILLLPVSAVGEQQQRSRSFASLIQKANDDLQAWRQVVAKASNSTELHDQLIALKGPVLNDEERKLALPLIKAQLYQILDEAESQLSRKKKQRPPSQPLLLLPNVLRNGIASLILAIGFAGLARRPRKEISLLLELEVYWNLSRMYWLEIQREKRQQQENDASPTFGDERDDENCSGQS